MNMVAAFDFAGWVRLMVAVALGTVLGVGLGCSKQRRDGRGEVGAAAPAVVLNVPRVIDAGPPADAALGPAPAGTVVDWLEDLDGDGRPERIWLSEKGLVTVGAATLQLEALSSQPFSFGLLDLDPATPQRHLSIGQKLDDDEDPPTNRRLLGYRAGVLTKVFDLTHSSFNHSDLSPELGGAVIMMGGWEACEGAPALAVRERLLRHFRFDGAGMLVEAGTTSSGEFQDCNQLAACPFVYVGAPGHEVLAGEILRNIRGRALATTQGLGLPARLGKDGVLRVRLSEEKPEVTHLDAIVAEVDGRTLTPLECARSGTSRPAFCDADGSAHLMMQGDSLVLTFDVADAGGGVSNQIELRATGYYVPMR